jgi:hypothetical protein
MCRDQNGCPVKVGSRLSRRSFKRNHDASLALRIKCKFATHASPVKTAAQIAEANVKLPNYAKMIGKATNEKHNLKQQ